MKAMLCSELGGIEGLEFSETPTPEPGPGEVSIDVGWAGVNFPDLLLLKGLYQAQPPLPFAPGFEVAGTIRDRGEGVTSFDLGQRVMATMTYGGYAEVAAVPEETVVALPDAVELAVAGGLPIVYGTAYHALVDRADLAAGETLLVLGAAGGVGLATVLVGKLLGARVIAAVGSEEKAIVARRHGADETILYEEEDLRSRVKELTDGRGADVIFDPVGGDIFDSALRALAWRGRVLVIGFTAGRIPTPPTNLVLLRGSSIVGVFWGSFQEREPDRSRANFETLLEWVAGGKLVPHISMRLPLERAREALAAIASRTSTGKIVLEVG